MKMNAPKLMLYPIMSLFIALAVASTADAQPGNQPPLPVKVTNTEPIPVSGTVTVASSPGAPVSVTGNVNVAGQVTVTNAANTTLNVRDLNSVAKTPIQLTGSCNASEPPGIGCSRIIAYNVPSGKLLIIEYVSTRFSGPDGTRGKVVIFTCMETSSCSSNGPFVFFDRRAAHYLDPTGFTGSWTGTTSHAGTSQKVLIFGNNKDQVTVDGQCSPFNICGDDFFMTVTMSGYLIDNP